METKRLQPHQLDEIIHCLSEGKLVALPTDTVYGLGVIANNAQSIQALRQAKQRPDEKAFAYVVNSLEKIQAVCDLQLKDIQLIKRHLPGPITFIFKKKKNNLIIDESGLDTLAIRIPNHPLLLSVLEKLPVGIYLPSANISGQPATTNSQDVHNQLNNKIDAIVEGQSLGQQASTIIDASTEDLKLLREGPISLAEIKGDDPNER